MDKQQIARNNRFATARMAMLAASLIALLTVGALSMHANVAHAAPAPGILITEVLPNPSLGNGTGDAYEYIEVYNNTTSAIDLSQYRIKYYYSSTSFNTWDLTTSFPVPSESTAVIWIRPGNNNNDNAALTRDDFRSHYGLTAGELPDSSLYVLSVATTGLGNTSWKSVVLATDAGAEAARASYNSTASGSVDDTRSDRGIVYSYPSDGSKQMIKLASNQPPTPGSLLDYQVPNGKELLITELMVNSTAGSGTGDAYEYVEMYNNSRSPLDLKDYRLSYHWSASGSAEWDLNESVWLEPQENAVAWVRPAGNEALTKNDFRSHYGVSAAQLPDDRLILLSLTTTGLGNTDLRWVNVERDGSGQLVSSARYNEGGGTSDTSVQDAAITYKYPFGNSNDPLLMRKIASAQAPTPGTVAIASQAPPAVTQPGNFYYFGSLHAHTGYSDGASGSTPQSAMTYVRDHGDADFFAITEHSHYNFDTVMSSGLTKWQDIHRMADLVNKDDEFVTIGAFEMTWAATMGRYGHMNTFLTDWYVNPYDPMPGTSYYWSQEAYYDKLKEADSRYAVSQFNHPSGQFGTFDDFNRFDPVIDGQIQLVEMRNDNQQQYYSRVLDKGWHVSPTNNQDNHAADWITKDEGRTVVVAPRNTRADLFEAMRQRRTYSSQDKNIQVKYTVNGEWMGSILNNPGTLDIQLDLYDPDPTDTIAAIAIIADGETEVASWNGTASNSVIWDTTLTAQYSYYYARITQSDGNIILTAPVWTGGTTSGSGYAITNMAYTVGVSKSVAATVSNRTGSALSNVKVEFYENAIAAANKIGETTLSSIPANGEATAVLDDWPALTGSYKLYAQATIPIGSVSRAFVGYTVVPELLITEVVASNGAPSGGTDPYEFIEIYNNTNSTINLKNYKIVYAAGTLLDGYHDWNISSDKNLAAGETMVLWARTGSSAGKTLADFNAKYGTSLTAAQVYELAAGDGVNNTATNRLLYIAKDDGTEISRVSLNNGTDSQTGEDVTTDKSVVYAYPQTGTFDAQKIAAGQTPTPGSLISGQVPPASLP